MPTKRKPRKPTPLQTKLRKQVSSRKSALKKRIKSLEERGYIIPEKIRSQIESMMDTQGMSTREMRRYLEKASKLTIKNIVPKSQYVSELSFGEVVSGEEGLRIEREAKKGADEGLNVLMSLIDLIDELVQAHGGMHQEAEQVKVILQREYSLKNADVLKCAQDNVDALVESVYSLFSSGEQYRKAALSDITTILFSNKPLDFQSASELKQLRIKYDDGV